MGSRKKICTAVLPVLFASLWHYETVMSGLCSLWWNILPFIVTVESVIVSQQRSYMQTSDTILTQGIGITLIQMIPPHTGTCIRLSLFTCTNERIHTRAHAQIPLKPPSKWTSRFCQQCRLSTILLWMSHWLSVTSAKQVKNIPPYIVFFLCPTHSTPPAAPIG